MLCSLKIENIAIIESAEITFSDGLNVLSGETGAGKSIIIDALSAVLGERTSKELIRTGESSAKVVAVFESVSKETEEVLKELNIDVPEDHALQVQRIINMDGKNQCRVNGTPVTVGMLKTLGRSLISIHGQHDSQNLLNPEYHYLYLDSLGNLEKEYQTYLTAYQSYSSLYREYKKLIHNEEERNRRIDYLNYEIREIEEADIKVGEYDDLLEKRTLFRNSEKITGGLRKALAALTDGEDYSGAVSLAFEASSGAEQSARILNSLQELSERISELAYGLGAAKTDLETALFECAYDPSEQDVVEARINQLHQIQSKYGATEEEILAYLEEKKSELQTLLTLGESREETEAELERRKEVLLNAANTLSLARKHAASEFEVRVQNELQFLDMPNVELSTKFEHCKLNPTGSDVIEFLIAPNPGEALKPLAKIASGGELSRIMLAIQNVLSVKGNVGTVIFDEIDSGLSGSSSEKVAIKLKSVSKKHQVICITHSAQVAAYADTQFKISKEVLNGKTYTIVTPLEEDGRVEELARILGGVTVTDLQRKNAKELLTLARNNAAT